MMAFVIISKDKSTDVSWSTCVYVHSDYPDKTFEEFKQLGLDEVSRLRNRNTEVVLYNMAGMYP